MADFDSLTIPVQTADGKIALLECRAPGFDELAIPVQTADGKVALVAVRSPAVDELCFRAQTADGQEVLVTPFISSTRQILIIPTEFSEDNSRVRLGGVGGIDGSAGEYVRVYAAGAGYVDPRTDFNWLDAESFSIAYKMYKNSTLLGEQTTTTSVVANAGQNDVFGDYRRTASMNTYTLNTLQVPDEISLYVSQWDGQDADVSCNIYIRENIVPYNETILGQDYLVSTTTLASGSYTFSAGVTGWTPNISLT